MLLKPLHQYIQDILRDIPQDGTFDQGRAVRFAVEMSVEASYAASFDLSAATDRLPVRLQARLVDSILPGFGDSWERILVSREYWLPGYRKSVHYSVGQPMGALSSWVLLALTHHFVVQLAAFRAGWVVWFPRYVVLGDDLVIFDQQVALQYLRIMEDLGVEINLSKSLISRNGSFEFAKRFIVRSQDVSPLSFKEMDASMLSLDALVLMLNRFGGGQKLSNLFRVLGFGYRDLAHLSGLLIRQSFRMKMALVWLTKPGNTQWSFPKWLDWLSMKSLSGTSPHLLSQQRVWDAL